MHTDRGQSLNATTRGYEQPSLEYGPQRLHYMYSIGIPQAYLTLFSILQGVVFGVLLTTIPLPQATNLPEFWSLVLREYCYLPYGISLGVLILIWLHQISITLTGGWPHSFLQVGLVTLLALFEVFAARTIAILPLWLCFTGCVSFVGGVILIRTGIMHLPEDFDASLPFQRFGHSLKRSEIRRGKQYLFIGISLITLAIDYDGFVSRVNAIAPSLVTLIPWSTYLLTCILLTIIVSMRHHRGKQHREARNAMYASTDIHIQNGIARYRENVKDEENTVPYMTLASNKSSPAPSDVQKLASRYQFLRFLISMGIISTLILQLLFHRSILKRL